MTTLPLTPFHDTKKMFSHAQKAPVSIDRARLDAIVTPIVQAHGAEVVDMEFKTEQGGWILRVFVEKLGSLSHRLSTKDAAVDLELCSKVARELSPALDVADVIPHRYNLEVSSPGVERPLKKREDFGRFVGEKAKLWLLNACNGQKVLTGRIDAFENDHIHLSEGSRVHRVPFADVDRARLVFEFGGAPKSNKSPHGKHPGQKKQSHK